MRDREDLQRLIADRELAERRYKDAMLECKILRDQLYYAREFVQRYANKLDPEVEDAKMTLQAMERCK